jgi:hypothetical protein
MVEGTANKGHIFSGRRARMAWFAAYGLLQLLQPADNTVHNGQEANAELPGKNGQHHAYCLGITIVLRIVN